MLKTLLVLVSLVVASYNSSIAQSYVLRTVQEPYVDLTDEDHSILGDQKEFCYPRIVESFEFRTPQGWLTLGTGMSVNVCEGQLWVPWGVLMHFSPLAGRFRAQQAPTTTSKYSYKIEDLEGQSVLKVQFKDLGFKKGDTSDFVNVQTWFYANGNLEVRYGPSKISAATAKENEPVVALSIEDFNTGEVFERFNLEGDPDQPRLVRYNQTGLLGYPSDGTVYRFLFGELNVDRVEPTLATQDLYLPTSEAFAFDLLGRKTELKINTATGQLDLSSLLSGVYLIRIVTLEGPTKVYKIVRR